MVLQTIECWTWETWYFMGSEGQSGSLVTIATVASHLSLVVETLGLVLLQECQLVDCFWL